MISSIVWVPAGVADPNPKKYEMSAQEVEIMRLLEEQQQETDASGSPQKKGGKKMRDGLQVKMLSTPAVPNTLPADLRMDEYSSDEDGEEAVGKLLMGQSGHEELVEDENEDASDKEGSEKNEMDDDSDDDDDEDDDLEDVPDTREFEPIDVEGLQAMGLNQIGNSAMHMDGLGEDDDESEADNVKLSDTDAIILVAKTEDVSTTIYSAALHQLDESTNCFSGNQSFLRTLPQ